MVEVAVAAGSFNTLAQALTAADLVDTLQGEGPFTVFAPTDEAFAALPEGALDKLLADPAALKNVLLLHVVSGKVMAADVAGISEATAMSGGTLPIDTSAGVKIGAATVTQADVLASNGVIHVIDTVLLPE
ncbi:MAG: fasciclin domain-containing protein [Myxococcota bacterium]